MCVRTTFEGKSRMKRTAFLALASFHEQAARRLEEPGQVLALRMAQQLVPVAIDTLAEEQADHATALPALAQAMAFTAVSVVRHYEKSADPSELLELLLFAFASEARQLLKLPTGQPVSADG